jgi:hypothetical protein
MPKHTRGRPKRAEGSTTAPQLNVMLQARGQMTRCIDCFDTLLYNAHDHARAEQGLEQLVLETMSALRRVYVARNGVEGGVP